MRKRTSAMYRVARNQVVSTTSCHTPGVVHTGAAGGNRVCSPGVQEASEIRAKDPTRTRNVQLPQALGLRVDEEMRRLSIHFGALVRIALSEYLNRRP